MMLKKTLVTIGFVLAALTGCARKPLTPGRLKPKPKAKAKTPFGSMAAEIAPAEAAVTLAQQAGSTSPAAGGEH